MTVTPKQKLNKGVREVVEFAEALGFEYLGHSRNNHVRLGLPNGGPLHVMPGSPGSPSWKKNAKADLRRKARHWADQKRRAEQKKEREQR